MNVIDDLFLNEMRTEEFREQCSYAAYNSRLYHSFASCTAHEDSEIRVDSSLKSSQSLTTSDHQPGYTFCPIGCDRIRLLDGSFFLF